MIKNSTEKIVKLLCLKRVGRKTALKLLAAIKQPLVDDLDLINLIKTEGPRHRLPDYLEADFKKSFREAEHILEASAVAKIDFISIYDTAYPANLKNISDPPLLLSVKGDIKCLNEMPCVALIGTREPTSYGQKIGFRLGEIFAKRGFNVISGLAVGCDTSAHKGTLNAGGVTTSVLAHGLDMIYPKENTELAEKILTSNGVLISEYFVGQKPRANFFVERDRIQAGLSHGVFVVETDIVGGTLHTVNYCLNNKRIVAAFNHPKQYLEESKTRGNQMLINETKAIPIYDKLEIESLCDTLYKVFKDGNPSSFNVLEQNNNNIKFNKESKQGLLWD